MVFRPESRVIPAFHPAYHYALTSALETDFLDDHIQRLFFCLPTNDYTQASHRHLSVMTDDSNELSETTEKEGSDGKSAGEGEENDGLVLITEG